MTKSIPENGPCCLCGLPYERLGNNPEPLSEIGRCCDACDEVVILARIDLKGFALEYERVEQAMLRMPHRQVMAAICAAHGPEMRKGLEEVRKERDEWSAGVRRAMKAFDDGLAARREKSRTDPQPGFCSGKPLDINGKI